jgi:EAL domain-containing protein (putative c-di-GMP-specific phosphodiesterase class I)
MGGRDVMNLPAAGWLGARKRRPDSTPFYRAPTRDDLRGAIRSGVRGVLRLDTRRPGLTILAIGFVVAAASGALELLNPGNYWLLFEDVSCALAPTAAGLAIALAAARGSVEYRRFRITLAISILLTAVGQIVADIPDVFQLRVAALSAVSDVCYVVGAVLGVAALMTVLVRRLASDARRAVLLDGVVTMAAAATIVLANWLHPTFVAQGQVSQVFTDVTATLVVPLVAAGFFASAAAAALAALSAGIEPNRRGVWAVGAGIVLLAVAWQGWIGRFLAGAPDTIEPMDLIFPAGALLIGYGGVTWSLRAGGGPRYERFARGTAEWVPIVAIVGCAFLDAMPRSRPLAVDPIALGTGAVVLLAMARYRGLLGRERVASERLTSEMSERAATTISMARLEAGATAEASADRICAEALHIGGIDTVIVFAFTGHGVVPLAHAGVVCRPVAVGEAIPADAGHELREHADFGLWLESWVDRAPQSEFDQETVLSGLRAEALAPLIWNDDMVGLLAMGATTPNHAGRLADRVATLTEFSVMSAAVLGPALVERAQREEVQARVQGIIAERAFKPVFQPIVDLATGRHVGFEALTRFSDGTRPDLCFLAADKVGMMVQLENAVLREQIAQARKLPHGTFVSLNVSPALATAMIPLLDVLAEADRPVVLEITEHVEIEDYPRLLAALEQVRGHAMLAVDDAGAGYAGLRHILELRPQYVKLDISLVRNVDTDPARQAMVTGMAHFADSVGCALIAEGIETANELTTLRLLNVPFGQGFYLAKPAAPSGWLQAEP